MVRYAVVSPAISPYAEAVGHLYLIVVQGCHKGDSLEGRTGFHARHSVVGAFVVQSISVAAVQVTHGFDFASCHFHEYDATPVGLVLGDLFAQTALANVHEVRV